MPLNGEYIPSTTQWVRDQVDLIERSGGTEGTILHGLPVIIVTTQGAKTGALRKNPVMRVEHHGAYAAVASYGGSDKHPVWYYNLRNQPLVEVQDGSLKQDMKAREITGDEKKTWWRRAAEIFPQYDEYQAKTNREIPIFLLEPVAD